MSMQVHITSFYHHLLIYISVAVSQDQTAEEYLHNTKLQHTKQQCQKTIKLLMGLSTFSTSLTLSKTPGNTKNLGEGERLSVISIRKYTMQVESFGNE